MGDETAVQDVLGSVVEVELPVEYVDSRRSPPARGMYLCSFVCTARGVDDCTMLLFNPLICPCCRFQVRNEEQTKRAVREGLPLAGTPSSEEAFAHQRCASPSTTHSRTHHTRASLTPVRSPDAGGTQ